MTGPRVLLAVLSERTSARGNPYLAGWLGKARVVGFRGEPDAHGNPTWSLYVSEPEPREGSGAAKAPAGAAGANARPRGGRPATPAPRNGSGATGDGFDRERGDDIPLWAGPARATARR